MHDETSERILQSSRGRKSARADERCRPVGGDEQVCTTEFLAVGHGTMEVGGSHSIDSVATGVRAVYWE